jgi:alpha-galactosidase
MRINNDTRNGGIIGVFKQGALEESRQVYVKGLDPDREYLLKLAPEGIEIHRASGQQMMEEGFRVEISNSYDGLIFEIGVAKDTSLFLYDRENASHEIRTEIL